MTAAFDRSNAGWQRDLCVSYWQMARTGFSAASGIALINFVGSLGGFNERGHLQNICEHGAKYRHV
jgi:hypothetical protein